MRIRSTKPEFWRSKTIAQLDWDVRFVLKGLESYVDDNGVGKNDIALIASDVFPRDLSARTSETLARLSEAISALQNAGLIVLYEADGDDLLYIDKWKDIQRVDKPNRGRFRRPDGTMEYADEVNRESYRNPPGTFARTSETLAPGTGEQGNRGTGEKEPPYPPSDEPAPRAPAHTQTKNGAALARRDFANLPARSEPAYRIAEAFSASLAVPVEAGLLSGIGVQIDKCLKRGIPPPAIAAGLRAWTDSDSWAPSQIPNFVHKVNNRGSGNGIGKPTLKAAEYGTAAEELLAELGTTT